MLCVLGGLIVLCCALVVLVLLLCFVWFGLFDFLFSFFCCMMCVLVFV